MEGHLTGYLLLRLALYFYSARAHHAHEFQIAEHAIHLLHELRSHHPRLRTSVSTAAAASAAHRRGVDARRQRTLPFAPTTSAPTSFCTTHASPTSISMICESAQTRVSRQVLFV